jgi:predicted ester cyclase
VNDAERNKAVVRAFVSAVNARAWAQVAELVAPDFVRHSYAAGAPGVRSREELVEYLRREFETFPDAVEDIADLAAEGDRAAVRHQAPVRGMPEACTPTATGKKRHRTWCLLTRAPLPVTRDSRLDKCSNRPIIVEK